MDTRGINNDFWRKEYLNAREGFIECQRENRTIERPNCVVYHGSNTYIHDSTEF